MLRLEDESEEEIDPINDIIDYLVRCAQISFKSYIDGVECSTSEKARYAYELYKKCPVSFLRQFGKYLVNEHLKYFEKLTVNGDNNSKELIKCIEELKHYHSDICKHKRTKNRRYKALQNLIDEGEYFSEKEMMYRNPLLYEQLIGQYLTDEEIHNRDDVDSENLTFLNMILETVDRNQMRETTNIQKLSEETGMQTNDLKPATVENPSSSHKPSSHGSKWGEFEEFDTRASFKPEVRKQTMINAPERTLLRQEFIQEMYNSFLEGRDDIDYSCIDNNELYDDLKQVNQDAEDKYFDSITNEVDNLEEHMKLVEVYGKRTLGDKNDVDPLDEFMKHINKKLEV